MSEKKTEESKPTETFCLFSLLCKHRKESCNPDDCGLFRIAWFGITRELVKAFIATLKGKKMTEVTEKEVDEKLREWELYMTSLMLWAHLVRGEN
jgi:hypothetical protein